MKSTFVLQGFLLALVASPYTQAQELRVPHALSSGQVISVHVFDGAGESPGPQFGLSELSSGAFLGVTQGIGAASASNRMIYSMTPGGKVTPVVTFADKSGDLGYHLYEGSGSYRLTEASDGNYYGVSNGEFPDLGNIFRLTPAGVYSVVYRFTAADGGISAGQGSLAEGIDGALYGFGGGDNPGGWGIYRFSLNTKQVTRVYWETSGFFLPVGTPVFASGTLLYGISSVAYPPVQAIVFSFDISSGTFSTVAQMTADQAYSRQFSDPLMLGSDGSLWFSVSRSNYPTPGCSPDCSAVYQVAAGQVRAMYTFPAQADVQAPVSLVLASDGDVYGVEYNPLNPAESGLFQLDPATQGMQFFSIPGNAGTNPSGPVLQDSQGWLRGTDGGGANSGGAGATWVMNLNLPAPLPEIRAFRPAATAAGSTVTVLGSHLVHVKSVTVGGQPASFRSVGEGVVKVVVPGNIAGGTIAITTAAGTGYSAGHIRVQ